MVVPPDFVACAAGVSAAFGVGVDVGFVVFAVGDAAVDCAIDVAAFGVAVDVLLEPLPHAASNAMAAAVKLPMISLRLIFHPSSSDFWPQHDSKVRIAAPPGWVRVRRSQHRAGRSKEDERMEYRNLGESGLQVSVVGLGCNNFGGRIDQQQTAAVVEKALDLGINLFDTADVYGNRGTSEQFLGEALEIAPARRDRRDEVRIADG